MSSKDDEKYFNDYNDMFISDGWKTLMNELEDNRIEIGKIENVKSQEDLWFRKGQIDTLAYMQNLEIQMELVQAQ